MSESVKKRRGGGSRKGVPNKVAADVKAMISGALTDVGGKKYLVEQARENPVAFMGLIGKILPKDVNLGGQQNNPITAIVCSVIDGANTKP